MNTASTTARGTGIPSVLLKTTMAATGLLMAGWLTLHMLGNLLVFGGPELMNAYAEKLRATGLLWPMRALLSVALTLHVLCAGATSARAWAARRVRYHAPLRAAASTLASRSMRAGGALLLIYLVYHVATLYGVGQAGYVPGDVHHNLVALLRNPWHAGSYVIATGLVALHLAHGLGSALISLGKGPGRREAWVRRGLRTWASLVTLGFAAPCAACYLGWV
jgi:succinate dehydrogenase / fumarate reductase, cytochrome b subunit